MACWAPNKMLRLTNQALSWAPNGNAKVDRSSEAGLQSSLMIQQSRPAMQNRGIQLYVQLYGFFNGREVLQGGTGPLHRLGLRTS